MGVLEAEFPEISESDLIKVARALRQRDTDAALRALGAHKDQRRQILDKIFIEFDQKHFCKISVLASAKKIEILIDRYSKTAWKQNYDQKINPEVPRTTAFYCWEALNLNISMPGYETIKRVLPARSMS